VHFLGLTVERPLRQVVGWAKKFGKAVTASFHGGEPRRNPLARFQQRQVFKGVSGLMFSAQSFADAWQTSGVIDRRAVIAILPEVSSPFSGIPKAEARRQLSIDGGPVFAWSGRLHPIKDPLTALKGFSRIIRKLPDARFLMAYLDAPLLAGVEQCLRASVALGARVTLLGRLPHEQIEVLFSAADCFVQSSLREFGGNSLVEALSCGAIPLVTDIPSFRTLTNNIGPAKLFACGDAIAMAAALDEIDMTRLEQLSARVRVSFNRYLSYSALAKGYLVVFESALANPTDRPKA
jgi:glycosyltransferase involved in cell wall biosynthesis